MARRTFRTYTLAERFWPKVERTEGCWIWTRAKEGEYGRLSFRSEGRRISYAAHRLSWELHFGPIPDSLWVLHKCDNPPCVRPDHLYLGTVVENTRDMIERGRNVWGSLPHPVGEQSPTAIMTEAQVREMRALFASGEYTFVQLGQLFSVSRSNAREVCRMRTWRHLV